MRSAIVRQFVSRPPSQRFETYGCPTRVASRTIASCACFFVPTKRIVASAVGDVAREVVCLLQQRLRLLEVDDVDAAALVEDEALHLRVPAARLVTEVHSGLQQLLHGDNCHDESFRVGWWCAGGRGRNRAGAPAPPSGGVAGSVGLNGES